MAKRKSIFDDIVGGFVGAAKGVQSWSESQARTFTNPYVNAAGRAIGKNPNLPVSGAKEAITNTAFGVVDVASGPIGRVAVKGARAAAGAAAKTGVVPRAINKLTGQMVGVHGSPVSGLKTINPILSSSAAKAGYTNPQVYAANPVAGRSLSTATDYSQLSGQGVSPPKGDSIGGSVYIVKGKIGSIKQEFKREFQDSAIKLQKDVARKNKLTGSNTETSPVPKLKDFPIIVSGKPFKVVKEFPVKNDLSTFYDDLKRYGARLPKKK